MVMRLDGIIEAHRLSVGMARAFAGSPANDNLTFAERVKAEIAAAARAVGEFYTERELLGFAADASEVVNSLRRRL
jgi:hypothetical protein